MIRTTPAVLWVSSITVFITGAALYAGPLNPPGGPVASTAKTLAEVEPRIAINASNTPGDADSVFKITQPGSYYLTGNIGGVVGRHGIEIAASGVTLDLMGFDLFGVAGSGSGIGVSGVRTGCSIRNGVVRGWGNGGVNLYTSATDAISNFNIYNVQAISNIDEGFFVGNNGQMENCIASGNTREGFIVLENVSLTACTAASNVLAGFIAKTACRFDGCISRANGGGFALAGNPVGRFTFTHCQAIGNTGDGFATTDACVLTECLAADNSEIGIRLGTANIVQSCIVRSNALGGMRVPAMCRIIGNNIVGNNAGAGTQDGIQVNGQRNLIEGNSFSLEDNALNVLGTGNLIVKNTFGGNSAATVIVPGNSYGPLVIANGVGSIGGIANSDHPQANFVY